MENKKLHNSKLGIQNSTFIISGGGTGGHIYPAIAIANALKAKQPNCNILFVGAIGKMEMDKVPEAGYDIIGLPIAGIQRSLSPKNIIKNLIFPFKLLQSFMKASSIIKKYKPKAVIGVGGYASGPIMLAAQKNGVPTLIQEQNSFAGITNKRLGKKASQICVAYPNMEKFFPKEKITLTGNPVRKDILDVTAKRDEGLKEFGLDGNKKIILAIGGSLGALSVNESIKARVNDFDEKDVQILWQTGKFFYPKAKDLNSGNVHVLEFIKRMDLAYSVADVVISRAGALSISELCLVGKPSVLVPFPYAAEDHQTHNAMSLVVNDAALLVKDAEARDKLIDATFDLLNDKSKNARPSVSALIENILKLGKPEAANEIADKILNL